MQQANGVVERAGEKKWKNNVFYNFSLVGDDNLYRTGTIDYGLKEGDEVEFEYEVSNYGNDVKSVKITGNVPVEKNKAKTSAGNAAKKYNGGGKSKDDYWTQKAEDDKTRQRVISYQAANKTAVDIVKIALEQDAVSLGSAKAKKLDALLAVIDQVTEDIFLKYQAAGVEVEQKQQADDNDSLDD